MFTCSACKHEAQDVDYLEIHIATEHAHYWAYECELCEFSKFPTDFALRQHNTNIHRLENFTVRKNEAYEKLLCWENAAASKNVDEIFR